MKKINVAIDGPSGAGKSIVALALAKKFKLTHINSGAMYRCVALLAKRNNIDTNDETKLLNLANTMIFDCDYNQNIFCNGENVTKIIRYEDISMLASHISKFASVRCLLVDLQRQMAKNKNCIMEGRDITTVVLSDAEVKIYLTADVGIRAQRRYLELLAKDISSNYDDVLKDLICRDYNDKNRDVSPLMIADDAIIVDSSYMSIDEVVELISKYILKAMGG